MPWTIDKLPRDTKSHGGRDFSPGVLALVALALFTTSCAARMFVPPAGPGAPAPDAATAWEEATKTCRTVTTFAILPSTLERSVSMFALSSTTRTRGFGAAMGARKLAQPSRGLHARGP